MEREEGHNPREKGIMGRDSKTESQEQDKNVRPRR